MLCKSQMLIASLVILLTFMKGTESKTGSLRIAKGDDTQLTFKEYVQFYNYPFEEHKITTKDGYILTYFRIQQKGQSSMRSGLPVMYLQHGLVDSADAWVINSQPDENMAPAFFFANQGFDVWCGNMRGNDYSLEHVSLTKNDAAFWAFSFDQMAIFDLPAAFLYIHQLTQQKINYIGHSQGTTVMFIALSRQDQVVQNYLNNFGAFAPIGYLDNQESTLLKYSDNSLFKWALEELQVTDIFSLSTNFKLFNSVFCYYFTTACKAGLWMIADATPNSDNMDRMNIFMEHFPKGTSLQNMLHFTQIIDSKKFQYYDYGSETNMQKYNQTTPPQVSLGNIQTNVTLNLYTGLSDLLADPRDVARMIAEINPQKVKLNTRYYNDFGHLTFYFGNQQHVQHLTQVIIDFGYQLKNNTQM